jgi:hypothetical protein
MQYFVLFLLLGLVPTILFYGALIGATAVGLGRLRVRRHRVLTATLLVAPVAYFAPVWGNKVTTASVEEQFARRLYPTHRVQFHGDLRLETVEYRSWMRPIEELPPGPRADTEPRNGDYAHGPGCGRVCLILLNTPGVQSVTVEALSVRPPGEGPSPYAVTYRLVPPDRCTTRIRSDHIYAILPWSEQDLQEYWKGQGKPERCLSGERPLRRFDFLVRGTETVVPARSGRSGSGQVEINLAPRPVTLSMFELFDERRHVLLREVSVHGNTLLQPLLPILNLAEHGPRVGFFAHHLARGEGSGYVVTRSLQRYTNAALPDPSYLARKYASGGH